MNPLQYANILSIFLVYSMILINIILPYNQKILGNGTRHLFWSYFVSFSFPPIIFCILNIFFVFWIYFFAFCIYSNSNCRNMSKNWIILHFDHIFGQKSILSKHVPGTCLWENKETSWPIIIFCFLYIFVNEKHPYKV